MVDMGVGRKKAVVGVCFAGFVAGCFSAWSLNNIVIRTGYGELDFSSAELL